MTSSSTYAFNPAASALTLTAFNRIGIRPAEVTIQHLTDAATESNLLQVSVGANQPLLWRSEIFDITLTQGTASYSLPSRMIAVQDIYLSTSSGGTDTDRMMFPLSLYEYDAQPNKTQQAPPTAYLIQKTLPPTITFWQVPDQDSLYTAHCRLLTQIQDVSQQSGATLDMPYVYLDVFVAGLAYRLARIWAPDKEMMRKQDYAEALDLAEKVNTQDNVALYIQPAFSGYYSR